ncbi:MAG: DUF2062 domain-containing protein [Prolixibacteraceae bacterium]|nr:DUF2062 domain-containing protein [Prolixibacteraceae bacterium]MBN2775430.1 DUF2062 domain-containing protein [Prolixibacteraceae bacterium]
MKKTRWHASLRSFKNYLKNSGQLSLTSKKRTAVSLTVGFYLGIFPIIGITTILCLLVSFIFRLNILILQAYNILFAPLQIFTAYLFLKIGRLIFFTEKEIIPKVTFYDLMHTEKWETLSYLFKSAAGGIFIWSLFFVLTGFFLFTIFFRLLNSKKFSLKEL